MAPRTRTLRTTVPAEVFDRLAAEAADKGMPLGRHVHNLIVARDARKYPVSETPDTPTKGK